MPRTPPNILVITTHDSGRHFGCYGVPTVQTPAIDRLAAEGVCFDNMFAASPICSPSRGTLLSGQYPLTNGLVGLAGGSWNWSFHDPHVHLSHRLHDAGYETAMFGLQHETTALNGLGFDHLAGHGCRRDGAARPARAVATEAATFMAARPTDQPFYAQVGFHETHTPYGFADCEPDDHLGVWMPPYAKTHGWPAWATLLKRFGGDPAFARRHLAELQGSVAEVDRAVDILLAGLERSGLAENTLVLFNTDHGPELPGAKWTLYDPGLRIAFIMRWPAGGITGGRRCDWLLGNVDFLPTLYALIGREPPGDLEGVSFATACRPGGETAPGPRETVYAHWVDGLNIAVRTRSFKLIRNLVPVDSTGRDCPPYELYDLEKDPLELIDVAGEPVYADTLAELQARMQAWLADHHDPVAHAELPTGEHTAMLADYRARYEAAVAGP